MQPPKMSGQVHGRRVRYLDSRSTLPAILIASHFLDTETEVQGMGGFPYPLICGASTTGPWGSTPPSRSVGASGTRSLPGIWVSRRGHGKMATGIPGRGEGRGAAYEQDARDTGSRPRSPPPGGGRRRPCEARGDAPFRNRQPEPARPMVLPLPRGRRRGAQTQAEGQAGRGRAPKGAPMTRER